LDYKKSNRSATCNSRPWQFLIPYDKRHEVLNKVRQECIKVYGFSFDECNKRKVCLSKKCIGRELEWKSLTALPYLKKFAKLIGISEGDDYIIDTDCTKCPVYKDCKAVCTQVNDWMNRGKDVEPNIVYKESLDNFITADIDTTGSSVLGKGLEIPWDCLSELRQDVVRLYLYDQKDFLTVAAELGLHDQARAKYEFYAGLTKLAEYATMRKFYDDIEEGKLTDTQRWYLFDKYFSFETITYMAERYSVSKQAVQQSISSVIKKYNLKWHIYVRKEGNKTIYNVPELMK
jgi:predicted DNA-binding protein YlxM (UPF0122 family)